MVLRGPRCCLTLVRWACVLVVAGALGALRPACVARGQPTASDAPPAAVTAGADGFRLQSDEGDFVLRLRGDVQTDARFFLGEPEEPGTESFYLRRARPVLQGTLHGRFDLKLMPNFALGRAELQDGYIEARFAPELGLRGGKFKTPIGLEFQQSPANLHLAERAFPTGLVPNRDVGLELHGAVAGGRLRYALGLFNGVPDGASQDLDTGNSKDIHGRLFATPFEGTESVLEGLGIGVAATWGQEHGTPVEDGLGRYRTSGRQVFFRYAPDAFADGTRGHLVPQAYLYAGPLGLMSEYAVASHAVRRGTNTRDLTHRAWHVTVTALLTGEEATFGRRRPIRPLGSGGIGAFEVAGRVHGLSLDDATFPAFADPETAAASALSWSVGLSWHANQNVRFMVNYEQTTFEAAGTAPERAPERLVLGRMQVAF